MESLFLSFSPPFPSTCQLAKDLSEPDKVDNQLQHLPGVPQISIHDRCRLYRFLQQEFYSNDLDRISDRLWWMSKQDSANISPLHRQLVKQRSITITEDPKLHLVWLYDRIFIKPLPKYLTTYSFWKDILRADGNDIKGTLRIRRAALGFLRTYHHLIKHESDLRIAQDRSLCLVSPEVTWEQFCGFTECLGSIKDKDVSKRFSYGEIRLTRLNFYAPFLLRKSHFQRVQYQYGSYFARFYVPVLFVMGIFSVILSGLQIVAGAAGEGCSGAWSLKMALVVSGVVIASSFSLLLLLGILFVYKVAKEWRFALRDRYQILEQGHIA